MSPVGSPGCPYCSQKIVPDMPLPFGLTTCSQCGERIWFLTVCSVRSFFRYEAARLVGRLFHELPGEEQIPRELGCDVLDQMELIMEFEAALEEAS